MVRKISLLSLMIGSVGLTSCSGLPDKPNKEALLPEVVLPEMKQWPNNAVVQQAETPFLNFGSTGLAALLKRLPSDNLDLVKAELAIQQAEATIAKNESSLYPTVSTQLTERHSHNYDQGLWTEGDSFSLTATYDFDFWDQKARQVDSAQYSQLIAHAKASSLLLTQQAAVAKLYLEAMAYQEKQTLLEEQLLVSRKLLEVATFKDSVGQGSEVEIRQQKSVINGLLLKRIKLRRDLRETKESLSLLLSSKQITEVEVNDAWQSLSIPAIATSQPAQLLANRADIKIAEADIYIAANQHYLSQVGNYPTFGLSGALGATDLLRGANLWTLALSASVGMVLYDGGASDAEQKVKALQLEGEQLDYQQTVLNAFAEVSRLLRNIEFAKQQIKLNQQDLSNAESLYEIASERYRLGADDFLTVLNAQKSLINAREADLESQLYHMQQLVNLKAALGTASPKSAQANKKPS